MKEEEEKENGCFTTWYSGVAYHNPSALQKVEGGFVYRAYQIRSKKLLGRWVGIFFSKKWISSNYQGKIRISNEFGYVKYLQYGKELPPLSGLLAEAPYKTAKECTSAFSERKKAEAMAVKAQSDKEEEKENDFRKRFPSLSEKIQWTPIKVFIKGKLGFLCRGEPEGQLVLGLDIPGESQGWKYFQTEAELLQFDIQFEK